MPDLDVLVELADFYDVDLRDIFNGQRRKPDMDSELKDTLLQAADYTNDIKKKITRRVNYMFIGGIAAMTIYLISIFLFPEDAGGAAGFVQGVTLGISFAMLIMGMIITGPLGEKYLSGGFCRKKG